MLVFVEGGGGDWRALRAGTKTNIKLNPHMASTLGIKPGPHHQCTIPAPVMTMSIIERPGCWFNNYKNDFSSIYLTCASRFILESVVE